MDLLDLRKQIDEIDEQLIPLLLQRMDRWPNTRLKEGCLF